MGHEAWATSVRHRTKIIYPDIGYPSWFLFSHFSSEDVAARFKSCYSARKIKRFCTRLVNRPDNMTNRGFAVRQFRVVAAFWIGMGLICSAVYLHFAVLGGRYVQGFVLAFLPVLQAIVTSIYAWRKRFSTKAEALIRSAVGAVAIAGICDSVFQFATIYLRSFRSPWDIHRIHVEYVVAILVVGGFAGGSVLGILRWRILEQGPQTRKIVSAPAWGNRLLSFSVWIAIVAVIGWLMELISSDLYSNQYDGAKLFITLLGLVLIAPIPIFSPVRNESDRWKLTLRYSKKAALIVAIIWGLVFFFGLVLGSYLLAGGAIVWLPYFSIFLILCFFWAYLFARSAQLHTKTTVPGNLSVPASAARPDGWILVSLACIGQAVALLAGVFALAPPSLGLAGIGCLSVYSTQPTDYWFWQGYKGISSETPIDGKIMFRPAVDPSVCVVFSPQKMYDHSTIQWGYMSAANAWFSLIDPEQWESKRNRRIRDEFARFVGRDFSSYDELRSWWDQNNGSLIWSGKDRTLELRQPDEWEQADPYLLRTHRPTQGWISLVQKIHNDGPDWIVPFQKGADPMPVSTEREFDDTMLSANCDREARLRGLKLYVTDGIEVLTGRQQSRAEAFLRHLTGKDLDTIGEWMESLNQLQSQNPWRISPSFAQDLLRGIYRNKHTSREAYTLADLRERTGLDYSQVEDFIPWLENPENTRGDEWEKAQLMVQDLCLEDVGGHCPRIALETLQQLTGKTFASPEEWEQWWNQNKADIILSADGRTLTVRTK